MPISNLASHFDSPIVEERASPISKSIVIPSPSVPQFTITGPSPSVSPAPPDDSWTAPLVRPISQHRGKDTPDADPAIIPQIPGAWVSPASPTKTSRSVKATIEEVTDEDRPPKSPWQRTTPKLHSSSSPAWAAASVGHVESTTSPAWGAPSVGATLGARSVKSTRAEKAAAAAAAAAATNVIEEEEDIWAPTAPAEPEPEPVAQPRQPSPPVIPANIVPDPEPEADADTWGATTGAGKNKTAKKAAKKGKKGK